MRNAIRPVLALLTCMALMFVPRAAGQTQDWPWLGVIITDISSGNVEGYSGGGAGSYVTGVEHAGPASAAGLHRHDIIVAVDGRTALNTRELTCIIQGKRPGDVVSVTILRGGRQRSVAATLGSWPPGNDFPRPALASCGKDPVSWAFPTIVGSKPLDCHGRACLHSDVFRVSRPSTHLHAPSLAERWILGTSARLSG